VTYPEQGPSELPPTVPNPATPNQPSSPWYPPGVAPVPPPPADPYATGYTPTTEYGYGPPPAYGPPGYPPQPPPGYPGAPYPPPPKRSRTGLIVGIIVGVLVLCIGGGVAAAVLVNQQLKNNNANPTGGTNTGGTPTQGQSQPPTAGPTTPPSDFTGDLRQLLVPRPSGADPWEDFPSKDGNLDLDTAADLFQDPGAMKNDLRDQHFRRGAVMHWTQGRVDVLIILFQFEDGSDADGFVDSTEGEGIEDHDSRGEFGGISGSLTYVANKSDDNGKRSTILLSRSGNIVSQVVLWNPSNADLEAATELAVTQHGRLP